MALYHKWDVKNDFAYALQFFSLISNGLGGVYWLRLEPAKIIQWFFELMMKTPQPVLLLQEEGRKPPLPFAQVQTWSWQASRKTLLIQQRLMQPFFLFLLGFFPMLPAFNISCIISLLFFCRIFSGNENTNFSCRFIIPIISFTVRINCSKVRSF